MDLNEFWQLVKQYTQAAIAEGIAQQKYQDASDANLDRDEVDYRLDILTALSTNRAEAETVIEQRLGIQKTADGPVGPVQVSFS